MAKWLMAKVWNKIDLLKSMSFVPPEAVPVCAATWRQRFIV